MYDCEKGENDMKTCDKCQHYSSNTYKDAGDCALMGDSNDHSYDSEGKLGLTNGRAYGWDYESYRAGVYVTPKFGCINWVKNARKTS